MRASLAPSKINYVSFGIFVAIIPISQFLSVRLLVLSLIIILFTKVSFSTILIRGWDIILYLLIQILGLFYSDSLYLGVGVLETSFSLLAIPVILSSIRPLDKNKFQEILLSFIIGLALACLVYLGNAAISFYETGLMDSFFFYQFTKILNFQPTYLAYYLVFAITFALHQLNYEANDIRPSFIVVSILFFFSVLMLTGGRTSFISMLFVFSFFILSFFLENKSASQKLTVGLILVMTICMFATSAYEQDDRVLILNDSWDRYDLWKSAISANTDVFFGVGTGDYKIVLNKYFHSHGMAEYEANNLNAHNQFIQIFLSNGILGLMSLIILLGRPLVISFRRRNTLGILVFFPFLLYGITEVFLGRYQGVVFFAFLHQVLMAHLDSTNPTLNLKHP